MMMKCNFFVCCFKLKFFLTFWSEFITFYRDNCFAQCVAIVGSQPNFFLLLSKSCLHPLRYHDKSLSLSTNQHSFYFLRQFQFDFVCSFSQLQVWKHFFSPIRLSSFSVDTWSLVYHMIAKVFIGPYVLDHYRTLITHFDVFHC